MTMQHTDSTTLLKRQQQELLDAAAHALAHATKKGATAEVAVTKVNGLSVSTRLQEVENIEFNNDGALGISVYLGQQKGNASTADLSKEAVEKAVDAAIAIAHYTSPDDCAGLADKSLLAFDAPDLDLYHPHDIDIDHAISLAQETERAALDYDKRIVNSDGASFNSHSGIRIYGNTEGMLQSYLSSRYSLSCSVIGQENEALERDYEYSISRDFHKLATPEWIGRNSAVKTLSHLNPQKIETQNVPVIFMNDVATGIIGHFAAAISGGSLYRKASFLLDSLGKEVLPDWFRIEERPHLLGALASTPFDSEGVKTMDRTIVDNGILQTYLLTNYSAKKMGMQTTGHAGGIHNWLVKPNMTGGLDALLKKMGTGLLVTDLMGQGVNLVTGDYSRGASGFWVENGEIKFPVAEITIAGYLQSMMKDIVAITDDVEHRSNIQTGSMLINNMKISGN
ncbi:peptidase U62 modulator of DNA gyrase [Actinobacillus delphinicola]|uniref:Peptidase U62 modulator of DNA gyrase n=2 Tax=Actinobacillus delphinicola TaxID=51161 RepID=A0A448TV03_9PAST|nr:peptidase U62 modulator of DNA gyrase [Actinobacillus delphinicola]